MLPSLLSVLLLRQAPVSSSAPSPARLVGASMFKNGFAVTQRLIDVPKTGATIVMPVPQGALGTLWFTPSDGMTLDSVAVEEEALPTKTTSTASSVEEILGLNVGGAITLVVAEKEGPPSRLSGKLVSAAGGVVVVEGPDTTRAIPKSTVLSVEGKGLKWSSTADTFDSHRVMRVRTSGRPGRIAVVALERGLSWSPSYAVNLQPDGKSLTIVAKGTIVNELEALQDADCRFVTGFPNLPFAFQTDPLVGGRTPFGGFPNALDASPGGFGGGAGGGFGGQEARRGGPVGTRPEDAAALQAATQEGESLGELFFYPKKGVSVAAQGRAAYTLFAATVPYETVYAWDLSDPAPGQATFAARILPPGAPSPDEIWQTLRFTNDTHVPLTTAPATTFENGEILGQDTLRYVSPGQTAELRVTRTLDVSTDFTEEEVGRERGFVKEKTKDHEIPLFDRVTAKGTLTIVNRKPMAVKMRIRKPFTGVWGSAEGSPKVSANAAGLRMANPTGVAEWTPTIAPGATLKLTYTVRLLVDVRGV